MNRLKGEIPSPSNNEYIATLREKVQKPLPERAMEGEAIYIYIYISLRLKVRVGRRI